MDRTIGGQPVPVPASSAHNIRLVVLSAVKTKRWDDSMGFTQRPKGRRDAKTTEEPRRVESTGPFSSLRLCGPLRLCVKRPGRSNLKRRGLSHAPRHAYRPRRKPMSTELREPEAQTFVETALKLGGKSEEEARKTGIARPGRRPGRGPVRRAVPDGAEPGPPGGLGPRVPRRPVRAEPPRRLARLRADDGRVARGRRGGTATPGRCCDDRRQDRRIRACASWAAPATGACWSTREYGGQGAPFAAFARVPDPDGDDRADRRRAGLGPRLHRRRRPGPDVRQPRAEAPLPAAAGQRRAALGVRADRARRRLRPDRPADHGRARRRRLSSSTARSCSSPTPSPAGRSAWSA